MKKNKILFGMIFCSFIVNDAFARGPGILIGPDMFDRKSTPKPTPEEYREWPGDNRTTKRGDKWVVPKVVGSNFDTHLGEINSFLEGFKIRKVTRIYSEKLKGTVISQAPKENLLVLKKGTIDIVVSNGPDIEH